MRAFRSGKEEFEAVFLEGDDLRGGRSARRGGKVGLIAWKESELFRSGREGVGAVGKLRSYRGWRRRASLGTGRREGRLRV